jgi:hypothetical protein
MKRAHPPLIRDVPMPQKECGYSATGRLFFGLMHHKQGGFHRLGKAGLPASCVNEAKRASSRIFGSQPMPRILEPGTFVDGISMYTPCRQTGNSCAANRPVLFMRPHDSEEGSAACRLPDCEKNTAKPA